MAIENVQMRVCGHQELVAYFAYAKDHQEAILPDFVVSFVDSPRHAITPPGSIPILTLHVNDIHKDQMLDWQGKKLFANIAFDENHGNQVLDFMEKNHIGESQCLCVVQCAAGISRSTATAIAMLVHAGASYELAFSMVERIRPQLHPNKWIIEVFDNVMGENGRLMEYFKDWYTRTKRDPLKSFAHVPVEKHYLWGI